MTKKELLNMLDCQKRICREWGECDTCPGGQSCREAEEEIRRLIESSGEAGVGDEEREKLLQKFDILIKMALLWRKDKEFDPIDLKDFGKIRSLIRQRRTVSGEVLSRMWNDIKERGQYGLIVCLQELGYTIVEPKKEGEEEK